MAAPAHSTTLSRRLFLASGTAAVVFAALHAAASPPEEPLEAASGGDRLSRSHGASVKAGVGAALFAQVERVVALHAAKQPRAGAATETLAPTLARLIVATADAAGAA